MEDIFVLFCAMHSSAVCLFFVEGTAREQAKMKNKSGSRVNRSRRFDRGMGNTLAGGVNEVDSSAVAFNPEKEREKVALKS